MHTVENNSFSLSRVRGSKFSDSTSKNVIVQRISFYIFYLYPCDYYHCVVPRPCYTRMLYLTINMVNFIRRFAIQCDQNTQIADKKLYYRGEIGNRKRKTYIYHRNVKRVGTFFGRLSIEYVKASENNDDDHKPEFQTYNIIVISVR